MTTPYEELRAAFLGPPPPCDACTDVPCPDHAPQPGDEELGRVLLRMWGDMVVARCADPRQVWKGIGTT